MASTDDTPTTEAPTGSVSVEENVGGGVSSTSALSSSEGGAGSNGSIVSDPGKPQENSETPQAQSTSDSIAESKAPAAPPAINFDQVPSLRGTFFPHETGGSIKGLWAMMDSQHGQEGMTSEFELHFMQGIGKMTMDAVELLSGKYRGWFRLKRLNGNGTDKVEEKNVILNFSKLVDGDGQYSIKGEGSNRFGTFLLSGTLSKDNSVIMYRQYVVKVGAGGAVPVTYKAPAARKPTSPRPPAPKAPPTDKMMNQRDGAGRERKKSNVFSEEYLAGDDVTNPKPKAGSAPQRTHRLSQHLLKCGELLRELNKIPTAVYFMKPVDPVALNIPDYLTLIQTPMDFQTIFTKLQNSEYSTPVDFANDVRLVFKNAITYNQLRDNPVHMAARDMSMRFEEKYKALMHSMHSKAAGSVSAAELAAFTSRARSGAAKAKPKSSGNKPKKPMGVPGAAAPDGSMIQMLEMQRKMMEMQRELSTLRGVVGQDQVAALLEQQQAASQTPLTYHEKKALIDSINEMPSEHMEKVIVIVQEATRAHASGDDDEDIEIPLDELDTSTLRKLQRLVEEVMPGRKRHAPAGDDIAPPAKRQSQSRKPKTEGGLYEPTSVMTVDSGFGMPLPPAQAEIEAPTDDYGDFFNADAGGGANVDLVSANADAWAASSAQAAEPSGPSGGSGDVSGAWGEASAEMQAKQEREQQRRIEEERLQQQRRLEEQQRAEALSNAAKKQEEERRIAAIKAERDAEEAAKDLQRRREEERRQREAMSSSVNVDSSDLLKQMEADV